MVKQKAIELLADLPLSKRQREIYIKAIDRPSQDKLTDLVNELENALNSAPLAFDAAQVILARRGS